MSIIRHSWLSVNDLILLCSALTNVGGKCRYVDLGEMASDRSVFMMDMSFTS